MVGSIIDRLLGDKHQKEMERTKLSAQHYMQEIHSAFNDPENSMPDDVLNDYITKFSSLVGNDSEHTSFIKKQLNGEKERVKAAKTLAQMRGSTQSPSMGVPAIPGPAPAQPQPAPTDDSSGPQTQFRPQGVPPPPGPFASGAPTGGPAPIQGETPATKQMADNSGTGFGGGMPAPPSSGIRFSSAQMGQRRAERARPTLEMQGDVAREQMPKDYAATKAMYENEPWFKELSKQQQAEVLTKVHITAMPHFTIPGVTMSTPGDIGLDGTPVAEGTPGKRTLMNGNWFFVPEPGALAFSTVTNPDGTTSRVGVNRFTGTGATSNAAQNSSPNLSLQTITNPDGTTKVIGVNRVTGQQGAAPDPKLAGVNPAMAPTQTSATHFIPVTQPDGSTSLVEVQTGGSSQKIAPGLPKPPSGAGPSASGVVRTVPNVGGKSLTPGQRITFDQKAQAFDATIQLATSVKNKLDLLGSLLTAKKIDLQLDPSQGLVKAFINRNVPLTKEEAGLAANFANLLEHINTLRIPLGAAGFRGHEAFSALQMQAGRPMANPQVTRAILENTIKTLEGQRNAIRQGLSGKAPVPAWANDMTATPQGLPAPPTGKSLDELIPLRK